MASLPTLGSSSSKMGFGLLTAEWSQGVDELLTKWLASRRQEARPPGQLRPVSEHGTALLPLQFSWSCAATVSWVQKSWGETTCLFKW